MALPTLAECKAQLRVRHTLEDDLIESYRVGAIDIFEKISRRVLSARTITHKQNTLDAVIDLPQGPVTAITSVTVRTDSGTVTIDSSNYIAHFGAEERQPGVSFKTNATLPTVDGYRSAVTITYTAETNPIPDSIKLAILSMVTQLYEFRVAVATTPINELPHSITDIALAHLWSSYR